MIWNERFTGGSGDVTMSLGTTRASVKVYDPTIGASPMQSLARVDKVTLTLSDHPVIVEIVS